MVNLFDDLVEYRGFVVDADSAEYNHIINWLPFGGGALYLGTSETYAAENYAALHMQRGSMVWLDYGDLIWMCRAFSDPLDALMQFEDEVKVDLDGTVTFAGSLPNFGPDSGNTLAMTYHWITTQPLLGRQHPNVTSDHPLAAAFAPFDGDASGLADSYVGYSRQPRMIGFSDGTVMDHPGGGYHLVQARTYLLDIQPGACPAILNPKSQGTLRVALLGDVDRGVNDIDPASVRLAGAAPMGQVRLQDVATPDPALYRKDDPNDCAVPKKDGIQDLILRFDTEEVVDDLGGPFDHKTSVLVPLQGTLRDGTPLRGWEIVLAVGGGN